MSKMPRLITEVLTSKPRPPWVIKKFPHSKILLTFKKSRNIRNVFQKLKNELTHFRAPLKLHQIGWEVSVHSHFQISPGMFNWIQVWALAGPLKDIHRVVLKPLLWYLGCVLRVIKDEPSHQSEVKSALEQVCIQDVSVHCCIHLSLLTSLTILTSLPVPAAEKHPHSMMLPMALLPRSLSLDGRPALGRVLLEGSPLSTEEGWSSDWWFRTSSIYGWWRPLCSLGPSKQQNFFCTLPQICSSRQSCLGGLQTIPLTSCLVCTLTCTVNCGTLYRQVCVFPNHVQSTDFTISGLQLSCRNISRMISGNRMHLSYILCFVAKAVNTYVHVIS